MQHPPHPNPSGITFSKLKTPLAIIFIACGGVYILFTVGSVAYMQYKDNDIKTLCTTDLLGKSHAEIKTEIDSQRFSVKIQEHQLTIHSLTNKTDHRCHVSINEHGISNAAKVIFHF